MNYLRGFVPWIAFAAVSTVGWQWGALAGLLLGLRLVVQERRAGVAADALILEISTALYFAVLTALAYAMTNSGLHHYTGALSMGWLAVTAWATLAVRRPFTLGIARRQAPEAVWENPVFLRLNTVLTSAWAAAFTITAAVLLTVSAAGLGAAVSVPVQIAGFVLPALFTARYPERVRARMAATAAGAATADA
ncbi:hypothetical protein GA0115240_101228 [Streptomyces sp. DvalAA-14]|uniref:hypothetical protein n=1 Tax=unclassified Streptomyces TaxID=2593676 RepID=UPI00081BB85C|nr:MULTISPECIES: hypothetical protein [unclassified Streptomyces]MYS18800.1 hypothetical protein [Streptomyces sp. SID4948]SCD29595.1 hypothetical protein GA0115240_101228 [Streptomyces sp. DvalAA-14]